MTQLPQTEIDRIKANALQHATDLHVNREDNLAIQSAYIAGAIHEAERGREMMGKFAEWADENDFRQKSKGVWENLNGTSRTTAELLDIFIAQNQKAKTQPQ